MFERLFFSFFCHRIRVQFVFHVAVLLHAIATARTVDVFVPFDPGQSQREVERGRERSREVERGTHPPTSSALTLLTFLTLLCALMVVTDDKTVEFKPGVANTVVYLFLLSMQVRPSQMQFACTLSLQVV